MKVYFEDGRLVHSSDVPDFNFMIDAGMGVTQNESALNLYSNLTPDCAIYTNSLVALNNKYCWNDDLKVPELYLRAGENNEFTRVDQLTDRELREGHNLMALYRNGDFYKANYPKMIELKEKTK